MMTQEEIDVLVEEVMDEMKKEFGQEYTDFLEAEKEKEN